MFVGKRLLDWEEFLIPFFDDINFVGEIPLSLPQIYQIGEELRKSLKGNSRKEQHLLVKRDFPRSFVTFLALMSAYNTEVDYWGNIKEIVGVRNNNVFFNNDFHWGRTFIYLLKKYKLETFELDQFANRYVTTIRLHGGIPAHSLPDFFDHIIKPYLNEPEYLSLDVEEFIPLILETPNAQYYVDKPVKYFLEHLPSYAKNYVSECKRMAYDYQKDPDNFDSSNYDLPKYVIRTFQKYKENELLDEDRRRLKRPLLYLDPFQGGDIYFKLPSQEIIEEAEAQDYFFKWKITAISQNYEEIIYDQPVRVRRIGYDLITQEIKIDILTGIQDYKVAFVKIRKNDQTNIEVLRRWRFNLLQIDAPLIAFDSESGKYLPITDTLPSSTLWLIYPMAYDLFVRDGKPGVRYPPFSGVLSQYFLREWDLSESDQIILSSKESGKKIPYVVEKSLTEPVLLGDNCFSRNQDPDSTPVFIGYPPKVLFPQTQYKNSSKDLSQWKLSIKNKWSASPEISQEIRLADYEEKIQVQDDGYLLNLAEFLQGSVIGSYQLIIHGTYGPDSYLDFRVIPTLEIAGLKDFYLPNHPSYQHVKFLLCIPKDTHIELLDRSMQSSVDIRRVDDDLFDISVNTNVDVLEIVIVKSLSEKSRKDIRVPIFIPIIRPSFKILVDQKPQTEDWSTEAVILSVDELLQSEESSVLIRFQPPKTVSLKYRVDLVDLSRDKLIQAGAKLINLERSQIISRFPLGQFNSTINRRETSSSLSFIVKIFGEDNIKIDSYPILYLRRYLELDEFSMEILEPGVRISWKSQNRLENRRLRIWSLWKPWQPPLEINIPDSCENYFETRKVGLPESLYKVQFFTAAPWKEEPPLFYPPEKGFIVQTKSVRDRLGELNQNTNEPIPKKFLHSFEKACIYNCIPEIEKRDEQIQKCWNLITCNPGQIKISKIINFYQWLNNIDANTRRALIYYLLKPEVFLEVLESIGGYSWAWKELVDIFTERDIDKISIDVALIILNNETDPLIRLKAFEVLVNKGYSDALQIILDEILSGQLSEKAAISLIKKHPSISFRDLFRMTNERPELESIIDQWAIGEGWLVKVGDWVNCDAGWGKIKCIMFPDDQIETNSFYHNVEAPSLNVEIRPGISNLKILIDLSSKLIFFEEEKLYQCSKDGCTGFVSPVHDDVKHHNDICHDGMNHEFRILTKPSFTIRKLQFQREPPINIWS